MNEREFANGWCCCFVHREGGIRNIVVGVYVSGDFVIDGGGGSIDCSTLMNGRVAVGGAALG